MTGSAPALARRRLGLAGIAAILLASTGCAVAPIPAPNPGLDPQLSAAERAAGEAVGLSLDELAKLKALPLYRMRPAEVGRYLAWLHRAQPDLRERIAHLGRKNIGQPYEIYLLGEFPYETIDEQPLFSLDKSDCVVFAEHTYAMALSRSWEEFFWMLQRIRYKDGVIGITTRNHYTETDWNKQNAWLVREASAELAGPGAATYPLTVDRARFFKNRYQLSLDLPRERAVESYVPVGKVDSVLPKLETGDFVNVISGTASGMWASHVGIVVVGADGERRLLHSAAPAVREESFATFIERANARSANETALGKKAIELQGFKFLRLVDAPNPPPMAPQPRPGR